MIALPSIEHLPGFELDQLGQFLEQQLTAYSWRQVSLVQAFEDAVLFWLDEQPPFLRLFVLTFVPTSLYLVSRSLCLPASHLCTLPLNRALLDRSPFESLRPLLQLHRPPNQTRSIAGLMLL